MVKLAMIGAGGYAYELIKRIWKIPDKIELIAVTSNPARESAGREPCRQRGIPVYADVDELIKNVKGKCDVIFIPTPIHTHYPLCKKCIEAGFDVFMEKPPVATIQELDSLLEISRKNRKRVAIAFQALYSTLVQRLKKRICAGEFGKVKRVRGMGCWLRSNSYFNRTSWAGKIKLNENWVLDGTVNNPLAHMLADELYLASRKSGQMSNPVSVQAELYKGHNIQSEDTSSLRVITDEDVEIIFNSTLCAEEFIPCKVVLECEKAEIRYEDFTIAEIKFKDGETEHLEDNSEQRIHMLKELVDCYENNKSYYASLEVCRPFTLTVNSAFESSGKIHEIDDKYIKEFDRGEAIQPVINNINGYIKQAHREGRLFSETDIPWAAESDKFEVSRDYNYFPSGKIEF